MAFNSKYLLAVLVLDLIHYKSIPKPNSTHLSSELYYNIAMLLSLLYEGSKEPILIPNP
jgi:hypothetical protein